MENDKEKELQNDEILNNENDAVIDEQTDKVADETEKEDKKGGFFSKKKEKSSIKKLEDDLAASKAEYAELNDRFLRLYSEFDNFKKRVNKEKLDLISTASEKVIVEMLPIVDDFERAIAANEKVDDIDSVKEGFSLIYNKLVKVLHRFDVEEIEAKGEVFNTDFHEAVTHFPTQNEEEKGKVIDVTEKGYKLKDKVIRFAKVVVGQ